MNLGLVLGASTVALLAAGWAALFALAEEATARSALRRSSATVKDPGWIGLHRALHHSRLALLIIAGVAAAEALHWWLRPGPWDIAVLAVAVVLGFTVGEAFPRALATAAPEAAQSAAGHARGLLVPFAPLLWLILRLDRWTQVNPKGGPVERTPGGSSQRKMLLGLFSLADNTVADIMTPRPDMAAVDLADSLSEVMDAFRSSEHTRLPVYDGTPDAVTGVLYAKDVLSAVSAGGGATSAWHDLVRPATFVPEAKSLDAQLRDFQAGPSHIAIVVDEYGGTAGLVTREDVLEEIVGEIRDEHDVEEEAPIREEGDDRFWVDGSVSLDDLSEAVGTTIERDDVATVGGLVLSVLGRVPRPGEEFRLDGFRVVVEQVVRRRVTRVYFERLVAGTPVEHRMSSDEESQ